MGLLQRIEKIKAAADLLRFVQQDGVDMKEEAGGRWRGCCPFHDEKTGSFVVYPTENRFVCYGAGCEKKGSIIDYIMLRRNVDLKGAVDALGDFYGIPREDSPKPAGPTYDDNIARRIAQEYLVKTLREHPDLEPAREWLKNRNVMPEDWEKWGIGGSSGTALKDLEARIDRNTMVDIGISGRKDAVLISEPGQEVKTKPARYWDYIKPGWITFPIYDDAGRLCYWYLRDPDNKQCYQAKKEHRRPGGYFFNQKAIAASDKVFIVEGVFEVIQIHKAQDAVPAAAALGGMKKDHIEYLRSKRQGDPHFPERVKRKQLILWGDRDANASGQTATIRAACELFQYHEVIIAKNPMGIDPATGQPKSQDPDDYLRSGGRIQDIDLAPYTKTDYDIEPTVDGYLVYRTNKKGERYPDQLTNFTFDIKYKFTGTNDDMARMVQVHRNGTVSRKLTLGGGDCYQRQAMLKWLHVKHADAWLRGDSDDYEKLMEYIRETDKSQCITMTQHYGHMSDDIWVYDDGCVYKGEIIKADASGIIPVDVDGQMGLRTTAGTDLQDKKFKPQRMPKEPQSIEWVIEQTAQFYPGYMAKIIIGWSAACIFRDVFVEYYEAFPHLGFLGCSNRGKTKGQRWVQALCGANHVPTNTCRSTKPSFMRHAVQFCNMPVPFSEYTNEFEDTLRDWYDQNLYSKAKGDGLETINPVVNAACTFTTMATPTGESLLNRCVLLDYTSFHYDRGTKTAYDTTWSTLVKAGGGFGFLLGLLRSDMRKSILQGSLEISKLLLAHKSLRGSEDRLITTYSIVYGAFWSLYKDPGHIGESMRKNFRIHGKEITLEDLIAEIEAVVAKMERIVQGQDVMQIFFEYMRQLHVAGDLDNHLVIAPVGGPPAFVRFNLGDCFNVILSYDNRTKKAMQTVTKSDIEGQIRDIFDIRAVTGRFAGGVQSCYMIALSKIRELYGVSFQSIKDAPEEEDAVPKSDATEPEPEEVTTGAETFDPDAMEGEDGV